FAFADQAAVEKALGKLTGRGKISLVIWTTTPWTLPANQAVSAHAEVQYVAVQVNEERLLIAEDLLVGVMARAGIADFKVVGYCTGAALENLQLQHPFYDR